MAIIPLQCLSAAAGQPAIRRGYASLAQGQIHYAECGPADGEAILLLHQTPRSWREFAGVLPILGRRHRAIAMDTVGFGDSMPPPWPPTIERWAESAEAFADALGLGRFVVVGHHTGGIIATELAARLGDRLRGVMLSSSAYIDEAGRELRRRRPPIDHAEPSEDGSHLQRLWACRMPFYPQGRPDLLEAFVVDALRCHGEPETGHQVVAAYRMETRIARVTQPVRILRAIADPYAAPHAVELAAHLPQAVIVDLPGGGVPAPDQMPEAFAAAVLDFLDSLPRP